MDGRTVWVQPGDVEGRIEAGNVVTATRELSDWCLRCCIPRRFAGGFPDYF